MKIAKLFTRSTVEFCGDNTNVKEFIDTKLNTADREDKEEAFYICDIGDVLKKWKIFRKLLPQVQPYYAVKCNPDKVVLKLLDNLGVNFDCASKGEIENILSMGVSPERIIFANPCKQTSHVKYAKTTGVKLMTFDNKLELYKIQQHHPTAELIIRIKVDDSKSLCKFGIKYGVDPVDAAELLTVARNLGLNVVGVSFHVGSGCYDASLFYNAVKSARMIFDKGSEIGFNFKVLDIGGGFPGTDVEDISFEDTVQELSAGFAEFFPVGCGVKIIAEPGRYFAASAFTLVTNITSVREISSENKKNTPEGFMYYLNDGVYGSFNCIMFDHQHPIPYALTEKIDDSKLYKCSIWGPTCDSLDCISKSVMLPKLSIGDRLCFNNMGAYTLAAASQFNGFKNPVVYYMCDRNLTDNASGFDY